MLQGRHYSTKILYNKATRVAWPESAGSDRMSEFVKIAEVKDVPVGTGISIQTQGKAIALFNCDGTFLAINDTCPHQGGPLGEGELAGTVVTCPWHEWRFDARTGVNTDDATCKVQSYPVKLDGTDVLIQL